MYLCSSKVNEVEHHDEWCRQIGWEMQSCRLSGVPTEEQPFRKEEGQRHIWLIYLKFNNKIEYILLKIGT